MTSPPAEPPAEPPAPPPTDVDRESAVRRLREAYAAEHLTHEEMDERLGRALSARSAADLDAAVAALPAEPPEPVQTVGAATGRIRRGGAWRLPRRLRVESAFGRVRLDLSRAVFPYPVLDIHLALGTGGARITVPRDAVVELDDLQTGWKDLRYRARPTTSPGAPTIRFSGVVGFGRLKIRHARR